MSLGDKASCVILVRGRAKTTTNHDVVGSELTLGIFGAGNVIAETCWTGERVSLDGEAVALGDCEVLFLPREAVVDLLEKHPRVAVRLIEALASKLRRMTDMAARRACLDMGDRLFCLLTELAASTAHRTEHGLVIEHGLSQNELASSIGASREAVNRQLACWRDQGFLTSRRGTIVVKDPAGLKMSVSQAARAVDAEFGGPIDRTALSEKAG